MPGYVIAKTIDSWPVLLETLSGSQNQHNLEGYYLGAIPTNVVLFACSTGELSNITNLANPTLAWFSVAPSRFSDDIFQEIQNLRPCQVPTSEIYERLIMRYLNQTFWGIGVTPFHEIIVKDLRYREELCFTQTILQPTTGAIEPPPQFSLLCSAFWRLYHTKRNPQILRAIHELIVAFAGKEDDQITIPATEDLSTLLIFAQGLGLGYQGITNNILEVLAHKKYNA